MLERRVTSAHRAGLTHAAVSARLPRVSGGADAHEGADQVLAGHASAGAVVQPGFALVVVCETNGTLSVRERTLATARRPCGWCSVWSWSVNSDAADGERGFSSASPLPSKHKRRRGSAPHLREPSRKQRLEQVTLSRLLQVRRRHGTLEDLAEIAALCNLMDGGGGARATSSRLWVYFTPTLSSKQSATAGSWRRAARRSHSGRTVPLHIRPSSRRMYPVGHLHSYEPSTLTQRKAHSRGLRAHSLMSARGREIVWYCQRCSRRTTHGLTVSKTGKGKLFNWWGPQ